MAIYSKPGHLLLYTPLAGESKFLHIPLPCSLLSSPSIIFVMLNFAPHDRHHHLCGLHVAQHHLWTKHALSSHMKTS
jgi:hypothetical protein